MADQKRLFAQTTHGTDFPKADGLRHERIRVNVRTWCGKMAPAENIVTKGTEPTCWQCKQIFKKAQEAPASSVQMAPWGTRSGEL
jgi:hypothetical protein